MANFSSLKKTTKLSETQYYSIRSIVGQSVELENDLGEVITVNKGYVESCLISSDEVTEEKALNKTDLANLFLANPGVVMTVNFNKQAKEEDVKTNIVALYPNKGGKILSEAEFAKKVGSFIKEIVKGEERTMVGRHYGSVNEFGRVQFIDMEEKKDPSKTYDNRQKQVDPRTLNWLIIKGIKYNLKLK